MSRLISELLGATEPMFSIAVRQLEETTGKQGIDVRLTAELIGQVQQKTKDLGLDPKDTNGKELYYALLDKLKKDDRHLADIIGVSDTEDVTAALPIIREAALKSSVPKHCWVLKKSVAKEFLRRMPPRNIMAKLNYKSIDSLLKNENILEIYGALRFAERPEWLEQFNLSYSLLKPSDFETRDIEIFIMPDRWKDVAVKLTSKKQHNLTHLKELGTILILPTQNERVPGIVTMDLSLIFHYFNEIRLYSSYFKLHQVRPDFAKLVSNTLNADPPQAAIMAGQQIHWRIIQRYYGKLENEYHPEIFEPHVQPEDLHWRKAETLLFEIDEQMGWWRDLDFIGITHQGRPVSFNMMDVSDSFSNQKEYKDRTYFHFRESLWNELFERYMGEKVLEQQVLKQLDNNMISPETINSSLYGRGI